MARLRAWLLGPLGALLLGVGLHAAGVPWYAPAVVALGLFWLLAYWERRLRENELPPYAEVKEYPPGCLCIRGAFLDHPECPHHQNSYWSARDH